jgi:hypothetical protein
MNNASGGSSGDSCYPAQAS